MDAWLLPGAVICICVQSMLLLVIAHMYRHVRALWLLRHDIAELHERHQVQRRKIKTLRRRCIRIHQRLQECEDECNSEMSPAEWRCGPSLSTQGSGTEDETYSNDEGEHDH